MAKRRKKLIPGLSFSWKRALGVTRQGRRAKFGRWFRIP